MTWAFVTGFAFFKVQSLVMKLRPTAEEEMAGLDMPEMGARAYPDFQQLDATSPGMGRAPSAAAVVNTAAGVPVEQR